MTVYQTTQPSDAILIASLLEGNGISTVIDNQFATQWLIGMSTPAIPLVVTVAKIDADDAKSIVTEAVRTPPRGAAASTTTHRMWLIALAFVVPCSVSQFNVYGGSIPFAAAGAWAALAVGLILDLRDRRPGTEFSEAKIGLFFLTGALVSVAVAITASPWPLSKSVIREETVAHALAIVGPVEELAKFLPVFVILLANPAWCRDPFAWILATAAAGAGFGMVENLGKFHHSRGHSGDALLASCSGLLHPALSGMVGHFIAQPSTRTGSILAGIGGLFFASMIHGAWNALAINDLGWICLGMLGLAAWRYFRTIDRAVTRIARPVDEAENQRPKGPAPV